MSLSLRRMVPRASKLNHFSPHLCQRSPRYFHSSCPQTPFPRPQTRAPSRELTRILSNTQFRNLSSSVPCCANSSELVSSILPVCCPGCGAYAQTVEPNEPGYYSKTRKQTRKLLSKAQDTETGEYGRDQAAAQVQQAIAESEAAPKPGHGALLEDATDTLSQYLEKSKHPIQICDRCHDLLHHNSAVSAVSPSIHSIRAFLDETPYKHNQIYHVIDAADFPMSLVDDIYEELSIQGQRSRNRRSATEKYSRGKKLPTISFVITRSDLLAPTKELVDSKMEYFRSVLREKLNIPTEEFRLGNVHMISAHRGWWTKKVKEEIREHGGGIWIVGRANVGKSSFVEACLPKDSRNLEKMAELIDRKQEESTTPSLYDSSLLASDSLLPPAPKEDLYPVLPVVSSLPGTTVSPIRIPFGRGKGEVIDLPGLDRSDLADYVLDKNKRDLIMTKRIKPQRHTIKPGQSLLLGGGLVRITPVNADDVVMAACFVPLEAHLTKTEKAIDMQNEKRPYPGTSIVKEGVSEVMLSAGLFELKWDVTESHLPTSIAKAMEDKGTKPPPLPYRVMSTDILIEGCGWIELTAQIRAKSVKNDEEESTNSLPQVEIFTPNGKHIGTRPPIECWKFTAKKLVSDRRKQRPRGRQSVGQKKRAQHSSKL